MQLVGEEQEAAFSFHGFNIMTPFGVKEDFPDCHAMIGVHRVNNVDGKVKMFAHDANNWNHYKVIEVFVVFLEQVMVCLGSDQCDDSAE